MVTTKSKSVAALQSRNARPALQFSHLVCVSSCVPPTQETSACRSSTTISKAPCAPACPPRMANFLQFLTAFFIVLKKDRNDTVKL